MKDIIIVCLSVIIVSLENFLLGEIRERLCSALMATELVELEFLRLCYFALLGVLLGGDL